MTATTARTTPPRTSAGSLATGSLATGSLATGHTTATLLEASKLDAALDPAIRPLWHGARLAGPAFTVQGVGGDNLALHNAVAAAPEGSVLVVDAGGAPFGHWGEILAVAAQARGILGLVIDGAVRDSVEQEALGFPVFSRGIAIRGTGKTYPGQTNRPVRVGGVLIRPGDLIVGDADGVVSLPADRVGAVVRAADERVRHEEEITAALRGGASTLELYSLDPAGHTA